MRLGALATGLVGLVACELGGPGFSDLYDSGTEPTTTTWVGTSVVGEDVTCYWFENDNCWTSFVSAAMECSLAGSEPGVFDADLAFCGYEDGSGAVVLELPMSEMPQWPTHLGGFEVVDPEGSCLIYAQSGDGSWSLDHKGEVFTTFADSDGLTYVCPDGSAYHAAFDLFESCVATRDKSPALSRVYVPDDPDFVLARLSTTDVDLFRCDAP
jgi:hypothetical protein